jgi:chemotaxis protein CheC
MNQTTASTSHTAWETIFGPATHQASEAMGRWTSGEVELSLEEVCEIPLAELSDRLDIGDSLSSLVVMEITASPSGNLILVFDDENASLLVSSLLKRPLVPTADWGELESSALRETGNILGSAYLNSMTQISGWQMLPSPPTVLRDYAMSVIEQAVLSQAVLDDRVLLVHTRFQRHGAHVAWHMIFIPSPELLQRLTETIAQHKCAGC